VIPYDFSGRHEIHAIDRSAAGRMIRATIATGIDPWPCLKAGMGATSPPGHIGRGRLCESGSGWIHPDERGAAGSQSGRSFKSQTQGFSRLCC
jgi:hypothetical protein